MKSVLFSHFVCYIVLTDKSIVRTKPFCLYNKKILMELENAKSQDASRRSDESKPTCLKVGLGAISTDSRPDGDGQIRDFAEGDPGVHPYQCPRCGYEDEIIGKILERLDKLEARHLAFVRAHKSRLQARMNEDIQEEEEFLEESNQMRSDIRDLIARQQEAVV